MNEPRWLTRAIVLAIQAESVAQFGGASGLRDAALLDSALARPVHRFMYEPETDLAGLAAACAFGFARNHAFVDGNKRVAFQSMLVFLGLNGSWLQAAEEDVVLAIISLASGELDEPALARWIRQRLTTR